MAVQAQAEAKPVAKAEVEVVSIYPSYEIVVRGEKKRLVEVNGELQSQGTQTRKSYTFKNCRATMKREDFEELKARHNIGYGQEWMALDEWKAARKRKDNSARNFMLALKQRVHDSPPDGRVELQRIPHELESFVEEVFEIGV